MIDKLELALGVRFNQRSLLSLAITHSSYLNENPTMGSESNERLEFLGDSVIGTAIARELYRLNAEWPEGRLTQARAYLVSGKTLSKVSSRLGIGKYLKMSKGAELTGGRHRPSVMASSLEAVVGAVFLDQGYDSAESFVIRILKAEISLTGTSKQPKNPKSALQEIIQSVGWDLPEYKVVHITGDDHVREFTVDVAVNSHVVGRGVGKKKSSAEEQAASAALVKINQYKETESLDTLFS